MDVLKQLEARENLVTVQQLAKLLSVAPTTIYDWIRLKRLPVVRLGSCLRLNPESVVEWLRKRGA